MGPSSERVDPLSETGQWRAPGYPVSFDVQPQLTGRNRATTFFRVILGIPHIIIVGGFTSIGFGIGGLRGSGALAGAAFSMAVVAWFAIVFTGEQPRGLWEFADYYMRWLVRASAYLALLRDDYPPFGDGPYPTTLRIDYPTMPRDRLSVGLRIVYVIPHAVILFFLNIGLAVTSIIAWFAIVLTGAYPESLYRFAVGVLRWNIRVQAYALLMRDEYPPFSMEP